MVGDEIIGQKGCSMQSTIAVMYKSLSSVCVVGERVQCMVNHNNYV